MLRRTNVRGGQQVEFVVESDSPVSVVGDFNDWDPERGVLDANDEGLQTTSTVLAPGRYAFRYLRDGHFFDDPHADAFEPNGYGQFHGVLIVDARQEAETGDAEQAEVASPARRAKAAPEPRAKVAKAAAAATPSRRRSTGTPSTKPTAELPQADRAT
jgi:hypothetical protein